MLLDSLSKLIEACSDTACSMDKWLSRVESCGWLSHIKDVLTCACLVAQCINEEGNLLVVHGTRNCNGECNCDCNCDCDCNQCNYMR